MSKELVVCICSNKNEVLKICKVNTIKKHNDIENYKNNNYNNYNNYAQTVYDAIEKLNFKVSQYKALAQKKNVIYFLAIVTMNEPSNAKKYETDNLNNKLNEELKNLNNSSNKQLEELEKSSPLYIEAEKIFKNDQKIKERQHKVAKKLVLKSHKKATKSQIIFFVGTNIVTFINGIIDIEKIFNILTILTIIDLLCCLIFFFSNYVGYDKKFEFNCDHTTISEIAEKKEIFEKLKVHYEDKTSNENIYKNFKFLKFDNENEAFIISDEENEIFEDRAKKMTTLLTQKNIHRTDNTIKVLSAIVKEKIDDNKNIFNNKLIGINTDLNFSNQSVIQLKVVDYFTYISSDEMIFKKGEIQGNIIEKIIGSESVLNKDGHELNLRNIENCFLTNLIGVNLIVRLIFNDNSYYIINRQSMTNDVNQLKLMPSASGSLDLKDYKEFKKLKINNFKNLLMVGMFRELKEESYIKVKNYENFENNLNLEFYGFKLLGFARLVSKAGKPDFFGMVTFKVSSKDDFQKILDNYNECQNNKIGNFESFGMQIVDQNSLIEQSCFTFKEDCENSDIVTIKKSKYSPQLSYIAYLIRRLKDNNNF